MKRIITYTFDVTRYKLQNNGLPDFIDTETVYIKDSNYISATIKIDKKYPSDKYVKQLLHTSDGKFPKSYTLYPKFSTLWLKE